MLMNNIFLNAYEKVGEAMNEKHCDDPRCKLCAERMANKIIREESAKFYPGRGEMTEKEKAAIRDAGKKIYDYKTGDDLMIEAVKEHTKEDMIRAFVQGWEAGQVNPYSDAGLECAKRLLDSGRLGKEGE